MAHKLSKSNGQASAIRRISKRSIGQSRLLQLYVAAGGRCQFPGCALNVLEHPLTKQSVNHGEAAHIVAFSTRGARGRSHKRPRDIHELYNLMLLCGACHKLIDKHPEEYPVERLRAFKQTHEARIAQAVNTAITRATRTTLVRFVAPIGSRDVEIPNDHMLRAVFPNTADDRRCDISLRELSQLAESEIYSVGARLIEKRLREFFTTGNRVAPVEHLSVFAIGPIPLLMCLGFELDRNIPASIFERHHDTDDWSWKDESEEHAFQVLTHQQGLKPTEVALILSCSGRVHVSELPDQIGRDCAIYEIRPSSCNPSKNLVRTAATLASFKRAYEEARRQIAARHPQVGAIHVFPAVSPAIAVTVGRELIKKADPAMRVYDKRRGVWQYALEINTTEANK